jgi:hypothetical protein
MALLLSKLPTAPARMCIFDHFAQKLPLKFVFSTHVRGAEHFCSQQQQQQQQNGLNKKITSP